MTSNTRLVALALLAAALALLAARSAVAQPAQLPDALAAVHGVFRPLGGGLSGEVPGAPDALIPADAPPGFAPAPREGVVRHRRAAIDFGLLASRIGAAPGASGFLPGVQVEDGPLVFNFFDDLVVEVVDPVVGPTPNLDRAGWVLSGRVAGSLEAVHFVVHTAADGSIEAVAAAASSRGRRVEVATDAPGIYLIEELEPPSLDSDVVLDPVFTDDDSPFLRPPEPGSGLQPQGPTFLSDPTPMASSASASTVDVLVLTTAWYRSLRDSSGTSNTDARIGLLASQANAAFSNSGVAHRIAVRTYHTMFDVEGRTLNLTSVLTKLGDYYGVLRTAYGADLLHLLTLNRLGATGNICGVASIGPSTASPVGVTADGASGCSPYVFAHELGHNFGLQHDRHQVFTVAGDSAGASRFGYGFSRADLKSVSGLSCWRTVMAYSSHCTTDGAISSTQIQYFSNLTVTHPTTSEALGKAGSVETNSAVGPADAASVLAANMPTVAAFLGKISSPQYVDLGFAGQVSVTPGNACYGAPITVSGTVINKGTKASAAYSALLLYRWKATLSSAWSDYYTLDTVQKSALAASATSPVSFSTSRSVNPGYEQFILGVSSFEDIDPSAHSQFVWSTPAVVYASCQLALNPGSTLAKNAAVGFAFNVFSIGDATLQNQDHRFQVSFAPATHYLRLWVFEYSPGASHANSGGWALHTFSFGVNGVLDFTIPVDTWFGFTKRYQLYIRNEGFVNTPSSGTPDHSLTSASLTVTRIVGSSDAPSALDVAGARVLDDGAVGVPVKIERLDQAVVEAWAREHLPPGPFVPPVPAVAR